MWRQPGRSLMDFAWGGQEIAQNGISSVPATVMASARSLNFFTPPISLMNNYPCLKNGRSFTLSRITGQATSAPPRAIADIAVLTVSMPSFCAP